MATIQINFDDEEREFQQMQREFLCRSDASSFSVDDRFRSFEEKNDHPPSPKVHPPPAPHQHILKRTLTVSPTKKGGQQIISDACKSVYSELRKSFGKSSTAGGGESSGKSLGNSSSKFDQRRMMSQLPPPDSPPSPVEIKRAAKSDEAGDNIPYARPMRRTTRKGSAEPAAVVITKPASTTQPQVAFTKTTSKSSSSSKEEKLRHEEPPASKKPMREEVPPPHHDPEDYEDEHGDANTEDGNMMEQSRYTSPQRSLLTNNNEESLIGTSFSNKTSGRWLPSRIDDTIYGKVLASRWSCAEVSEFLDACGLGPYARTFAENGVDGSTLMELTHEQVRRGLHVIDPMHLLSLELGVEQLRQRRVKRVKDWEWSVPRVSEWLEAKGLGGLVGSFRRNAVHGGVLFHLSEDEFVSELGVGRESVLILWSLLACVERAREVGPRKSGEEDVPDWSPDRVKSWLESLSLPHLVPVFRQYAVNGALLLHLDAQSMRQEMGVTEIQALVLEKAIAKLKRQQITNSSVWASTWRRVRTKLAAMRPPKKESAEKSNKPAPKKTSSSSTLVKHSHNNKSLHSQLSNTRARLQQSQPHQKTTSRGVALAPPPTRPPRPEGTPTKAKAARRAPPPPSESLEDVSNISII